MSSAAINLAPNSMIGYKRKKRCFKLRNSHRQRIRGRKTRSRTDDKAAITIYTEMSENLDLQTGRAKCERRAPRPCQTHAIERWCYLFRFPQRRLVLLQGAGAPYRSGVPTADQSYS